MLTSEFVGLSPRAMTDFQVRTSGFLARESADGAHDQDHHLIVLSNALSIVDSEGLAGQVNMDALMVAALSHDIHRNDLGKNNAFLRQTALEVGTTQGFVDEVIEIINCHSYGEEQVSLAAKVLYDADKLALVDIDRILGAYEDLKTGKMAKEIFENYRNEWVRRMPRVRLTLHFGSSREMFDGKFEEAALRCQGRDVLDVVYKAWCDQSVIMDSNNSTG